jgi:uncharacterized protein
MPAVTEVAVPLVGGGVLSGRAFLRIALLPRSRYTDALIDDSLAVDADRTMSPIQLLESHEYRYEWCPDANDFVGLTTEPEEVFQPDSTSGLVGRLRTGLATGALRVRLRSGNEVLGELELEVRSRKLTYKSEYRWMLRDIAAYMSELIMQRFASSAAYFEQDATRDPVTLYQRFEFLRALLSDEAVDAAINEIRRRPHLAWEEQHDLVHAGSALKAGSHVVRSMSKPGNRVPWQDGPVASIPSQISRSRTEATHDTAPNRFVRFALERWRQIVADLQVVLSTGGDEFPVARGRRETDEVISKLDAVLHDPLFREVSELTHFPADNQVLHRREGYRDIFRAYLDFELAAKLSWKGMEGAYRGAQRNIAQLYEYWAFLQLAGLIAELVGSSFDVSAVLEPQGGGLVIGLRTGRQTVVAGTIERLGRRLNLEFCFNRTFRPESREGGTWTVQLRPDYSLTISAAVDEPDQFEPVILHFDAKYRVDQVTDLFSHLVEAEDALSAQDTEEVAIRREVKRADLLKMHAYRDAIRRSVGAYVLYPGDDNASGEAARYVEYRELLPGIGAFTFRPSADGEAIGTPVLRGFLDQVLDHVAGRLSRHERGRYWLRETYGRYEVSERSLLALGQPTSDTTVLLGYVKSAEHWRWIQERMTYNVRTPGRRGGIPENADILYSQLLVLYAPSLNVVALARIVAAPEQLSKATMSATGYPSPRSDYLCVQIAGLARESLLCQVVAADVERVASELTGRTGQPVGITWGRLCSSLGVGE